MTWRRWASCQRLESTEVLSQAAEESCSTLQRIFGAFPCPDTVLVRSSELRVATLPSFRRRTLFATDSLVSQCSDRELRFLVGREMGRVWLHHGGFVAPWTLQHFLRDVVLFPLHVLGLHPKVATPRPSFKQWLLVRRWLDGVANACDVYRGLRSGTWPGDLDLDFARHREPSAVDSAAALCVRLRAPGTLSALSTAALGSAAPRLLAWLWALPPDEARRLQRYARLTTWALGLGAAKARAEVVSLDRLGFLAAQDLDAAVKAMVLVAPGRDLATAALLGKDLVRQAEYLTAVLPTPYWSPQPSLHARVADLNSWAQSPMAEALLS